MINYHVYPLNQLGTSDHKTDFIDEGCFCNPEVIVLDNGNQIICHNEE